MRRNIVVTLRVPLVPATVWENRRSFEWRHKAKRERTKGHRAAHPVSVAESFVRPSVGVRCAGRELIRFVLRESCYSDRRFSFPLIISRERAFVPFCSKTCGTKAAAPKRKTSRAECVLTDGNRRNCTWEKHMSLFPFSRLFTVIYGHFSSRFERDHQSLLRKVKKRKVKRWRLLIIFNIPKASVRDAVEFFLRCVDSPYPGIVGKNILSRIWGFISFSKDPWWSL